jgi:hypothetical protein
LVRGSVGIWIARKRGWVRAQERRLGQSG